MTETVLLTERRDSVLLLTLNRPEAANSVNFELAEALCRRLDMAEEDPGISVVVITAAGTRFFCTGQDLKELAGGKGACVIPGRGWAGIAERKFSKPLIAAVNGYALGGGMEIALCCDIIIASENAKFGLPEVKRGIFAAAGGAIRIAHALPKSAALEMLLTGDSIDARSAEKYGMVNKVTAPEELVDSALELAARISGNAPLSLKYTKEMYYKALDSSLESCLDYNLLIRRLIAASEDAKEGPRAFAEKRKPQWKGK